MITEGDDAGTIRLGLTIHPEQLVQATLELLQRDVELIDRDREPDPVSWDDRRTLRVAHVALSKALGYYLPPEAPAVIVEDVVPIHKGARRR